MTARKKYFRILLFLFFLFSFSLFFFKKPTFAAFTKYIVNPIISGTPGGWDSVHAQVPTLIFDEGIYKMWYTGHGGSGWKIGFTSSIDGITGWVKSTSPVIDVGLPDSWEKHTGNQFVLRDGDIYKMWYASMSGSGGLDRSRIKYATSSGGLNWEERAGWLLAGTGGSWDEGSLDRGLAVLKIGTLYHMWYAGTNTGTNWQIGYATSPDGISWTKQNSGQPVISHTLDAPWEFNNISYPNVIYNDGVFEMWYATGAGDLPTRFVYATSTDGITWNKPADKNPVLDLGSSGSWDSTWLSAPFVMKQGDYYRMYYSGTNGSQWRIGFAEMGTPPTPTPTPTPIPISLQPLIILPGLGASWNHENIILGINKPQADWQMTPGVRVYDGLIKTLKNAGYRDTGSGKNLFIFNYNWSKSVFSIAEDLRNYIQDVVNPSPGIKIDLVGHSLGGLVARTYVQNNPDGPVDQLLTLGSPHHGVVQIYYPWEGGDLSCFPAWERIGIGLLLYLRNPRFSNPKDTIHSAAPVIKDLLPDFNYLKQEGIEKPVGSMVEKNDWLMGLNSSLPSHLLSALNAFVGEIADSTWRWVKVQPRTWLDNILNLWVDGKPTGEKEFAEGDQTILSESGQLSGAALTELNGLNHGELVQSIAGQQKIMEILGLTPSEISNLSVGLSYEPAMVFLLASPATLTILNPDGDSVGIGDGKLIIVLGDQPGQYQAKLTGTGSGDFSLYFGQIAEGGDIWKNFSGQINPGQEITYQFNFQPENPLENPLVDQTGANYLQSGRSKLFDLKNYINQNITSNVVKRTLLSYLNYIIHLIDKNKIEETIFSLYQMRFQISNWQISKKIDENTARLLKNKIQDVIADIEQAYIIIETNKGGVYPTSLLNQEISMAEKLFQKMENKLKNLESQGKAKPDYGALYSLASDKLNQAKNSTSYEAHIKALGARYLSQESLALLY